MISIQDKKYTLILNRNFQPIDIKTAKRTFLSFINGAVALDPDDYTTYTFDEWLVKCNPVDDEYSTLRSEKLWVMIPDILVVKSASYGKPKHIRVDRSRVFMRDKYRCGYCGKKFTKEQLTVDHIIPKSRGGNNTYMNLVTSCAVCNIEKDNKTLAELGWKLKYPIVDPNTDLLCRVPSGKRLKSWNKFLVQSK